MACLNCEIKRAKLLAQIYMLSKPRFSQPALVETCNRLTKSIGASHYLSEIDNEWWICRPHPVTFVAIKIHKVG